MQHRIYVTRLVPEPGMQMVRNFGQVEANAEDRVLSREELLEAVRGRDGVLSLLTDTIDAEVLDAARGVKVFANYAVGFDNVDLAAATQRGIMVTNTPGVLTDATADMAWALLFSAARRVVEADAYLRAGKYKGWAPKLFRGADLVERTLGIVGAGRIGTAMAQRSIGWRMKLVYCDVQPSPGMDELGARRVDLDTLLAESDFVSLHVSLTPQTRHLIGPEQLQRMKPTAVLVNTSRGPVIDERALVEALGNDEIAAAGLDVFEEEPAVAPGLAECPTAVVTPHIASATLHTRSEMARIAAENLIAALEGRRPPNLVNPEVLEH